MPGDAGHAGETQVIAFDLAGISLSAGAACSSGKVTASHVLKAMGVRRGYCEDRGSGEHGLDHECGGRR